MNNSKNSVRTLTMLALLVAMSIVFSRVLSISTGFVRFLSLIHISEPTRP